MTDPMLRLFLSYSHRDEDVAAEVRSRLRSAGHVVWQDADAIHGGQLWREAIVEGIENADAVVVLLSRSSVRSDHVLTEVQIARDIGLQVVPVQIQPAKPSAALRYALAGLQVVDLTSDREKGIEDLLLSFGPTPLPPSHRNEPHEFSGGRIAAVIGAVVLTAAVLIGIVAFLRNDDQNDATPATLSSGAPPSTEALIEQSQAPATDLPPTESPSTGALPVEAPSSVDCEIDELSSNGTLLDEDAERCAGLVTDVSGGSPPDEYFTGGGPATPRVSSNIGISHCASGTVGRALLEYRENDEEEIGLSRDQGWIRVDGQLDFGRFQPDVVLYSSTSLSESFEVPALKVNDDIGRISVRASGNQPGMIVECFQDSNADGLGDSLRLCWLECP